MVTVVTVVAMVVVVMVVSVEAWCGSLGKTRFLLGFTYPSSATSLINLWALAYKTCSNQPIIIYNVE